MMIMGCSIHIDHNLALVSCDNWVADCVRVCVQVHVVHPALLDLPARRDDEVEEAAAELSHFQ